MRISAKAQEQANAALIVERDASVVACALAQCREIYVITSGWDRDGSRNVAIDIAGRRYNLALTPRA